MCSSEELNESMFADTVGSRATARGTGRGLGALLRAFGALPAVFVRAWRQDEGLPWSAGTPADKEGRIEAFKHRRFPPQLLIPFHHTRKSKVHFIPHIHTTKHTKLASQQVKTKSFTMGMQAHNKVIHHEAF